MSDGLSFLVVEDDGAVRRTLVRGLSSHGTVESVGTCAAARMALRARSFDGIVLDVGLPDGSGVDLIKYAHDRLPGVCILVLTGTSDHTVITKTHDAGARFLLKPCDGQQLDVLAADARTRKTARERRTRAALLRWTEDYELTETEIELLELACAGVPRETFASSRGVRPDTIRKQVQMLLRKTGHDTFEAAVNGLLREALAEPF